MSRMSSPDVWKDYLAKKLENPEFSAAYEAFGEELYLAMSLARAREARNMTQVQLAEATGIKQPMIARFERGRTPALPTLRKIASALNARVVIEPTGRTEFVTL